LQVVQRVCPSDLQQVVSSSVASSAPVPVE